MQALRVAGFLPRYVKSQVFTRIPEPTSDFSGQTVIVTGANIGLGLEAARHLTRLGAAKVVLAVRSLEKGEVAAEDIRRTCKLPPGSTRLEVWRLDMADTSSIKAFAERVQSLDRLDAVILNAGLQTRFFILAGNGIESTIAVNTVGSLLLAVLLLPKLRESARETGRRGRLSIVGSDLMYTANLSEIETEGAILDQLSDREKSDAWMTMRYPMSKILLYWGMREISRRSPLSSSKENAILNVMTPGYCQSSIMRDRAETDLFTRTATAINNSWIRTTEAGGALLVLAIAPELGGEAHGRFLLDGRVGCDGLNVTSAQGRRLAAKWTEGLFGKMEGFVPGCTESIQG